MPIDFTRRALVASMFGAGCALTGMSAHAATGKVLFGYARQGAGFNQVDVVLKEIQATRSYEHDLGVELTHLPGAGGTLSLKAALAAAPDGATVLLAPSSVMTLLPQVRAMPSIDPERDFVPVAAVDCVGMMFAVGPGVPAKVKTLKDYAAWVRDDPSQSGYGVTGRGGLPHFAGTLLGSALQVLLKPVSYAGTATIIEDLAAGGLPAAFVVGANSVKRVLDKGIRPLAVTSAERWATLPAVPTMLESGVTNVPPPETLGLFMPARVPAARVQQLRDAVQQALRSPAVVAARAATSAQPLPAGADDYPRLIAQERAAWNPLVKFHRFADDA